MTCTNIGYKHSVPKKDDIKAWRTLEDLLRKQADSIANSNYVNKIISRHDLEQEIVRLRSKVPNSGREKLIKTLQKRLKNLYS